MADSAFDRSTAERARQLERLDALAGRFGTTLSAAFGRNLNAGRQLDGVLGSLATKLAGVALKAALTPVRKGIAGLVGSLLSSGSDEPAALARGGVVAHGRIAAFGAGGVFGQGRVRPFANGGIVAAPTYFPLSGGALGLMGEAGPEAVMPLRRGSDGRLGVALSSGARGTERPVAVTVNIATPDADSFRRSEAQVAASLARAVARGRRAL